jgi:hypothetical protein
LEDLETMMFSFQPQNLDLQGRRGRSDWLLKLTASSKKSAV